MYTKHYNLAKRAPRVLRINKVLSEFDQGDDIIMCVCLCVFMSLSLCVMGLSQKAGPSR